MRKYRKKPAIIEAIQFFDDAETLSKISDFMNDEIRVDYKNPKQPVLKIRTLEGEHIANIGDYIIKGIKGEFYPCKPDIFKMTYEAIEESR